MKYSKIAQERHFYDFVFYETDKDKMFIYCPNCNTAHDVDMKLTVPRYEKQKVAWMKKNFSPCICFDMCHVPKYCRSDKGYSKLGTEADIGEFHKNDDGSISVNVYRQTTNFAADNYGCARPFKRYPIYFEQPTIKFDFRDGEKTKIETCLHVTMCTNRISIGGYWSSVKNWRSTLVFDLLEQSLDELKGTYLEKYVPEIYKFQEALSDFINMEEVPMGDYTVQFLRLLCENVAFRKVWKAGYKTLAINKVFESIMIGGSGYYTPTYYLCGNYIDKKFTNRVVNWRGKTLERILKVNPQKLDNLCSRDDLTLNYLEGAGKLEKANIEFNEKNIKIVCASHYDALKSIFEKENVPLNKVFKYIRHTHNKRDKKYSSYSNLVIDYYDYLDTLQKLKTQLTADVMFPSNLTVAHDRAVKLYKEIQDSVKEKSFKKVVKKYAALNYENDRYIIYVIQSIKALKVEAEKLHNCSAGYVERIANENSVIFLIREKAHPKKPFYMLELNPHYWNIVQNRGLRNCAATDEVTAFATLWLNSVVLPARKKLAKAA